MKCNERKGMSEEARTLDEAATQPTGELGNERKKRQKRSYLRRERPREPSEQIAGSASRADAQQADDQTRLKRHSSSPEGAPAIVPSVARQVTIVYFT